MFEASIELKAIPKSNLGTGAVFLIIASLPPLLLLHIVADAVSELILRVSFRLSLILTFSAFI